MSVVRATKRGAVRVLGPLGGYALVRRLTRHSPRIFMYHRFSEAESPRTVCAKTFRGHIDAIARRNRIVSLGELCQAWRQRGTIPADTAVITVDDGYEDFVRVAWPILRERGIPATLFVSTRFADGDFWLWPDKLEYALRESHERVLRIDGQEWPIGNEMERHRCFDALCHWFTRISDAEKQSTIAKLLEILGVSLPTRPTADYAPASWAQLRELADSGIEIGGHTKTHPVLSRLPDSALDEEVAGCKSIIESRIGRDIQTFCYPNGQPEDINEAVRAAVGRAGFVGAVAAYFRSDVLSDPFEIKRYSASESSFQFRSNLEGVELVSSVVQQRYGI